MTLCKRIIGVILIENGLVVRREGFKTTSIIGRPNTTVKYLNKWGIDEIFIINVGKKEDLIPILNSTLEKCFIPVTVGGNIDSIDDVDHYIKNGADKVVIGKNKSVDLCKKIVNKYGTQSLCLNHDSPNDFFYEDYFGLCGEIIIHDIKRDGKGEGLNLEYNKKFNELNVPLIGMGGVGSYEDIVNGLNVYDSVAVGNLFHYKEISAIQSKREAIKNGILVRPV